MTRQAECICRLCHSGSPTQEDLFCDYCRVSLMCIRYRKVFGTKLDATPNTAFADPLADEGEGEVG